MAKHIEDEHQKYLIMWADLTRIDPVNDVFESIGEYLVHIPNGGKRDKREAGRLKAQGVRAGFPDLGFFYPVGDFHGLFIEMKKPIVKGQRKPKVEDNQKEWIDRLSAQGYDTAVCFGWHEARMKILDYLFEGKRKGFTKGK